MNDVSTDSSNVAALDLAPARPVVTVTELSKRFSGSCALDRVSFELHAGDIMGLLGPNGAGKTTTMKLLLGLLRPSNGSARVLGFDCTRQAREVKARIGYTPDEPQFYDFLTGRETIDFVIHARQLKRDVAWSVAEELLQLLELRTQLDATIGSYSLGMKKKMSLLCALLHRPSVLLLDEPTNGLDPPTAHRVRALLRKQARAGTAVLLSTHLLDMAERMCDRILLINEGRTVACGSAADLRATAGVAASAGLEEAVLQLLGRG